MFFILFSKYMPSFISSKYHSLLSLLLVKTFWKLPIQYLYYLDDIGDIVLVSSLLTW